VKWTRIAINKVVIGVVETLGSLEIKDAEFISLLGYNMFRQDS
jgi:hypothetical protein